MSFPRVIRIPHKSSEKNEATVPAAELLAGKVVIRDGFQELSEKSYGKAERKVLELSFVEALYLLSRERITLLKRKRNVSFDALMKETYKKEKRIHGKYVVYADLRDRGLVVKTGFKFGCDFRVYKRGVSSKKGPKGSGEHTRWIVHVAEEDYTCAFQELSRAVRLAHSIRARMLWAVVDGENNVTYYEVLRMRP
jgi:tRNA-intron endonuclease, archaea type